MVEEAIKNKVNLIISYHPILFDPKHSLIISNPSDRKIISLIHNKIAVYSPHTALDNTIGGVNDWLIKSCGPGKITLINPSEDLLSASARKITLNKPISITHYANELNHTWIYHTFEYMDQLIKLKL